MKIFLLPVDEKYYLLPRINPFCDHSHGFNVEIDFLNFLKNNPDLLTDNPDEADWHYLPIYWSYWLLANDYGRKNRQVMKEYLEKILIDTSKTFTVSEADNEPDFGFYIKVFSANDAHGDWTSIPILTSAHKLPKTLPEKKYLSNFVGNIAKWPVRLDMVRRLNEYRDIKIIQHKKGEEIFVNTILSSYTTLCPRGSSLGSYRFYESMQLGVVPIMISDYDFRPFKETIPWRDFSYFCENNDRLERLLNHLTYIDKNELVKMGNLAKFYWDKLSNQGWCKLLLDKL